MRNLELGVVFKLRYKPNNELKGAFIVTFNFIRRFYVPVVSAY